MMDFKSKSFDIDGLKLDINTNLKKYTTYKLEVFGNIAICDSINALQELIKVLVTKNYKYNVIGWGANQVLLNTKDVLFIKLNFDYDKNIFNKVQEEYTLPASVPLNVLTSHAQKFNLDRWEVFTGIPASLGGAIFMNAGTGLGEICEVVKSVDILQPDRKIRKVWGEELRFSYRRNHFVGAGEIIVSATLMNKGINKEVGDKIKNYLEFRKETQPLNTKNCGCVFKNHSNEMRAGQLIDIIGLKGLEVGGLRVSLKHANFIENMGDASAEDFKIITDIILEELEYNTGIRFELEAKIY